MTETIVACTDDTDRFDATLQSAAERARETGARLMLYDVTAPTEFTSPRPNVWAGEGARERYDHPLDEVELETLGRHNLALKVQRLRQQGLEAYGWLPEKIGGDSLAEFARATGARVVLVPAELDAPEVLSTIPPGTPVEYVG